MGFFLFFERGEPVRRSFDVFVDERQLRLWSLFAFSLASLAVRVHLLSGISESRLCCPVDSRGVGGALFLVHVLDHPLQVLLGIQVLGLEGLGCLLPLVLLGLVFHWNIRPVVLTALFMRLVLLFLLGLWLLAGLCLLIWLLVATLQLPRLFGLVWVWWVSRCSGFVSGQSADALLLLLDLLLDEFKLARLQSGFELVGFDDFLELDHIFFLGANDGILLVKGHGRSFFKSVELVGVVISELLLDDFSELLFDAESEFLF